MKANPLVPTNAARLALVTRFGLPYVPDMQDWEYEVASLARFHEFLSAYTPSLPAAERVSLVEILIQCVEDSAANGSLEFYWSKLEPVLVANPKLHAGAIAYWACLEAKSEEEMFHVAPLMRRLIRNDT